MSPFASLFSSDSSSIPPRKQHHVFISFRGKDTRYTFISHLRMELRRENIAVFNDFDLRRGEKISPALFDAIEIAKVTIVIFSENYASSEWCLNELVKSLECKERYGQTVIPVYYHVKPDDVGNQTGKYADSFAKHEEKGTPARTLQKWRMALKEASHLAGWDTDTNRDEGVLKLKIVEDIKKNSCGMHSSNNKNQVGIEPKVGKMESSLNVGSTDACAVGICGEAGVSKTTLPDAVLNKMFNGFECSCFLKNIRKEFQKFRRLNNLRQQLLSEISWKQNGETVSQNPGLKFMLTRKRSLIVFADVTDGKQITDIIQGLNWYDRRSRVIIVARNKQVLRDCGCKEEKIYEVNALCEQEAFQLFYHKAYNQNSPLKDYLRLSSKI